MKENILAAMAACALCIGATPCLSCRTVAPMQGMVYDQDSRPVPGYRLSLDGWRTATTDINGRFTFADASYGTHAVSGSDERFLPFCERTAYKNRTEVLHIKVMSVDSLYCRIDDEISKGDLAGARKSLDSIPEKSRTDERFRLYDGILFFRITGDRSLLKDPRK